jgi:hypothetical protein
MAGPPAFFVPRSPATSLNFGCYGPRGFGGNAVAAIAM